MVIDFEHGLILNKLIYPGMVTALVLSLAFSSLDIVPSIGSAVGGGGLGLGLFLVIAIVSRGGMGMGDVKLAALIGLAVGITSVLVAILMAVVSGGMVAVILLLAGKRGRRQAIPFGPYLSFAAIVALLYGQTIFGWYMDFF
jgi:leader peptidase (prepilin peptidase)/N-methyltransferase